MLQPSATRLVPSPLLADPQGTLQPRLRCLFPADGGTQRADPVASSSAAYHTEDSSKYLWGQ